jgi:hypothetical protein
LGDGKLRLGQGGQGGAAGGAGLTVAWTGKICADGNQDQSEYFQLNLYEAKNPPNTKSRVVLTIFSRCTQRRRFFCEGISAEGVKSEKLLFRVSEF